MTLIQECAPAPESIKPKKRRHSVVIVALLAERDEMKQILLELKQNQASYNVPTDDRLLYELKQQLLKAEMQTNE